MLKVEPTPINWKHVIIQSKEDIVLVLMEGKGMKVMSYSSLITF